ncbi:MAG: hypothetical protein ACR2KV_07620 [Solirubrobacteraceae bacterium]
MRPLSLSPALRPRVRTAPVQRRSRAPVFVPTTGRALAQATGAPAAVDAGGRATVIFGAPQAPTGPVTVQRSRVDSAPGEKPSQPAVRDRSAQTVAGLTIEAVCEEVLDRLRRELLIEHERIGDITFGFR